MTQNVITTTLMVMMISVLALRVAPGNNKLQQTNMIAFNRDQWHGMTLTLCQWHVMTLTEYGTANGE